MPTTRCSCPLISISSPGLRSSFAARFSPSKTSAQLFGKISSEQADGLRGIGISDADVHGQHRGKADDIISPEHPFNLRKIGFFEVSAVARWLEVYASDLNVERVFLGSHDQVRAVGPQFAADLVANVGGDCDHRRSDAHTQGDCNSHQQFAPLLPAE